MDISRLQLDNEDDPDLRTNVPTDEEYGDMLFEPRPDEDDEEAVDKYLNMELILDLGNDNERRGCVCKRARNNEGEPIGHAHTNPLFDTREYDVEFTDGTVEWHQVNVIAENMYSQVDDEGQPFLLLKRDRGPPQRRDCSYQGQRICNQRQRQPSTKTNDERMGTFSTLA